MGSRLPFASRSAIVGGRGSASQTSMTTPVPSLDDRRRTAASSRACVTLTALVISSGTRSSASEASQFSPHSQSRFLACSRAHATAGVLGQKVYAGIGLRPVHQSLSQLGAQADDRVLAVAAAPLCVTFIGQQADRTQQAGLVGLSD